MTRSRASQTASVIRRPPLAAGVPLVGSAFALGRDTRAFFYDQYRRLGPIFRLRAFHKSFTVLAGPEATLFVTRHGGKHLRSDEVWRGMDYELGAQRSLISMDGPDHARMRAVQKSGYQRAVIEQHLDEVVALVEQSVHAWPHGAAVPAHRALQRMVTDQLGRLIAGVSPDGYIDDLISFVRTTLVTHVTQQRPPFLRWTPGFRQAKARVHALGQQVLQAHVDRAGAVWPSSLIDDLIALSREDPAFLPSSDLVIGALGPFIAGLDTVASTASFVLYVLLTQPTLHEQVVAEVDQLFAGGPLTAARLKHLDVLHRTILETLRMYPIAPAITRMVDTPFEFGGYTVGRGEQVIISTTVAHAMPEFYAHPERFDIDRYLPERNEHRKPGAFAPFGAGAHVCLGAGFAEVHLMVLVAALLYVAQVTMDPRDYRLRIDPAPTPHPDQNFRIRVTPRIQG